MKQLDAQQIQDNFNILMGYIDSYISEPRKTKLKEFYKRFEERIALMPASSIDHFHSAYPGGYVEHVNRVIAAALSLHGLWKLYGGNMDNYTIEELVFVAMNHDIGKMGSEEEPYYVPNSSEWHRKNQGKIYEHNENLSKMTVPDRGLYLFQKNGITLSETEYLGIKLHDGMYDEANEFYLTGFGAPQKLKTNLPYIVHQADLLAARVEFEEWYNEKPSSSIPTVVVDSTPAVKKDAPNMSSAAHKMFDELFKQS